MKIHSTRSTSTSKVVFCGFPVDEIFKRAIGLINVLGKNFTIKALIIKTL